MSRHKAAQHCTIPAWLSARINNKEKRFIQIGDSFLLSPKFIKLTPTAKIIYLSMAMESAGKINFKFPAHAAKKYGISTSSLRRGVNELVDAQFITFVSGANLRKPNEYKFCLEWKLNNE